MSVATKNPFAILDAEDASRPSSPVRPPKEQQKPAAPPQKPKTGPASRGGKYYQRGGGTKSAPRDVQPNLNQNGIEEPVGKKFEGRGRGGRGGRGAPRGRGRQFDKHSQTGKTDSDKKIHQSWGGDDGNTEFKAEEAATLDAAAEGANDWGADNAGAADAWGAPDTSADAAAGGDAPADADKSQSRRREPEEEDNTLTFDEYLAQQKEKEASLLPKLEGGRKINEGDWKDVVPLQKNDDGSYFVGKTKAAPKARAKKEEKVYLEIEPRFERPSRGGTRGRGGERGDRRGGRGTRGGNFRGGRGGAPQASVDVDDQTAFPSLS